MMSSESFAADRSGVSSVTDPLVTIAIPTFNRASWLRGCIQSALSQTYQNLEVIVSDNASTDNTQATLAEFVDPRVRCITQKSNIGLMRNWNACLNAAKGQYLIILPDDDRLSPWMLESCVDLIRKEADLVMVVGLNDLRLTDEARTLPATRSQVLNTGIHAGTDIFIEYLRGDISVQLCSVMMRTGVLREIGGFQLDWPYAGDTATWGQVLMSGRAGLVNQQCGTFAWHSDNATSHFSVQERLVSDRRFVEVIDQAVALLDDPNRRAEVKRQARRYVARDAVNMIASFRRSGGSLIQALPMIWTCRRELSHVGLGVRRLLGVARPVSLILMPRSVSAWIGRVCRKLRCKEYSKSDGAYACFCGFVCVSEYQCVIL